MKKKVDIELAKKALIEISKFSQNKKKNSRKKVKKDSNKIWGLYNCRTK